MARRCLINSYLASARKHGLIVLHAIARTLTGTPGYPYPAPRGNRPQHQSENRYLWC
jgi:hypothetical protein